MSEKLIPLALLREGEKGRIVKIGDFSDIEVQNEKCKRGCCHGHGWEQRFRFRGRKRLEDMGFEEGIVLEMVKNKPAQPLIVRLENSQIALSRGLAMKIFVTQEDVT